MQDAVARAREFTSLVTAADEALGKLGRFELVSSGLPGDDELDFACRVRAHLADSPSAASQAVSQRVRTMLDDLDRRIQALRWHGHFSAFSPSWRFFDFREHVKIERDALGYMLGVVFARDARTFAAGERLLAHLSARGVRLPTYGEAEFAVLVRTTGEPDYLFAPVVRGAGLPPEFRLFGGAQVSEHTAAVRREQDERERREAAERAQRERKESDAAQLIGRLSDPATVARVREALGV